MNKTTRKTTKEFKQEIFDLVGNEYTVLGEYKNNKTKILMKHNKCGYEYLMKPNDFQQGKRCPKCNGGIKSNLNEFKNKVFKLVGDEYSVLSNYVNCETKILMKHNKCGYEYLITPNCFIQGCRCPKCNESKGEKIISKFLEDNNIEYNTQVSFPDCKYKKLLKFDFQIYIKGSSKIILLEYDGLQHFKPIFYDNKLELNQLRDNIKNEYCKRQGIHLYRISYKDFGNIESILKNIIDIETVK